MLKHVSNSSSVNELSGAIDLESTLVRAEALFRRFQRTIEAIDKKGNFPAPKLRHRLPHRPTSSDDVMPLPSSPLTPTTPITPPPNAYFPHGANPLGPGARKSSISETPIASTSGADAATSSANNGKTPDGAKLNSGMRRKSSTGK